MSMVHLLAAEQPLPFCDCRSVRTIRYPGGSVTKDCGFSVEECTYYPYEMACVTKPYVYAMPDLVQDQQTLTDLTAYLRRHCAAGTVAELWHLWLDDTPLRKMPPHYRGSLADLDEAAFAQLFENDECCLMVRI